MLYEIRLTRGDNYTSTVVDGPDMTGLARACPIEVRDYASMLAATWGEPGENMAPTTVEIATYRPVHLRQRTVTPARADIWLAWTVN